MKMPNPYTIPRKQPVLCRLPMVRLEPNKAAAFRALARQQGLRPTAALATLVGIHAEVRQPFNGRSRKATGKGERYTAALPDLQVPGEVASPFMEDVRAAGISRTEALRQLVERCLEQSSPKGGA